MTPAPENALEPPGRLHRAGTGAGRYPYAARAIGERLDAHTALLGLTIDSEDIMNDKLNELSFRQLVDVLKHCSSGSIGFDPFRDPRTNRKAQLVEYIGSMFSEAVIGGAIVAVTGIDKPEAQKAEPKAKAVKAVKAAEPQAEGGNVGKIAAMLAALMESSVDEEAVRNIALEAALEVVQPIGGQLEAMRESIAKVAQRPILHVQIKDAPQVVIEDHVHPVFDKVLKYASAGLNVMLKGPAGCGKTHLCEMVSKAMRLPFGAISGSAGASESQLVGRLLPTGDSGRFEYHASPFVNLYENGGCFLFDEIDAFDPNMLLVVNTAAANGHFHVEARSEKPNVMKHKTSVLLAAANTFGNGPDALYVGRNQLDAATLDRWYVIEMGYDRDFEAQLAAPEIVNWVWSLRAKVDAAKLRRVVSTRMIQKAHLATIAGTSLKDVKRELLNGWTRDELGKVGEAA